MCTHSIYALLWHYIVKTHSTHIYKKNIEHFKKYRHKDRNLDVFSSDGEKHHSDSDDNNNKKKEKKVKNNNNVNKLPDKRDNDSDEHELSESKEDELITEQPSDDDNQAFQELSNKVMLCYAIY